MPAPTERRRDWGRIAPAFVVLGIVAATASIVFPPMYVIGKRDDNERTFLRNYRTPNEYEAFSSYCMTYAMDSREDNDVVFVGDSSLRCDVRTSQFERETGLKAYNLGGVGLIGIRGITQITDAYLRYHPKPRLLVVCILPTALNPGSIESWPPEERDVKSRFLWCYGPGTEDMRPHNSFLYHVRQGFKYTYGLLVGGFDRFALEPIPARGGETFRTLEDAVTKERGFWAAPERRRFSLPPRDKVNTRDLFKVSEDFKTEFSTLMRVTADHGVGVLIRLTPFPGEAAEHPAELRAWAEEWNPRIPM